MRFGKQATSPTPAPEAPTDTAPADTYVVASDALAEAARERRRLAHEAEALQRELATAKAEEEAAELRFKQAGGDKEAAFRATQAQQQAEYREALMGPYRELIRLLDQALSAADVANRRVQAYWLQHQRDLEAAFLPELLPTTSGTASRLAEWRAFLRGSGLLAASPVPSRRAAKAAERQQRAAVSALGKELGDLAKGLGRFADGIQEARERGELDAVIANWGRGELKE